MIASIVVTVLIFSYLEIRKIYGTYINSLLSIIVLLNLLLFSILVPVFIERSMSYHITFYIAENEPVSYKELKDKFAIAEFNKRLDELSKSGFLQISDTIIYPTDKAILFEKFIRPIQYLTSSKPKYIK